MSAASGAVASCARIKIAATAQMLKRKNFMSDPIASLIDATTESFVTTHFFWAAAGIAGDGRNWTQAGDRLIRMSCNARRSRETSRRSSFTKEARYIFIGAFLPT